MWRRCHIRCQDYVSLIASISLPYEQIEGKGLRISLKCILDDELNRFREWLRQESPFMLLWVHYERNAASIVFGQEPLLPPV